MIRTDAVAFIRDLKGRSGKGIGVLGGGELAQSLFNADLIDQVCVNVQPVLFGAGIPLVLPMQRQIDLQPIEHRVLTSGSLYMLYRVKR